MCMVLRPEIASLHSIPIVIGRSGSLVVNVVGRERGAQCTSGITGRRLDPDVVEIPIPKKLPVCHTIQRHTSGKTEIPLTKFMSKISCQLANNHFRYGLDRSGQIHVTLLKKLIWFAR